ncbi:MAG: hypothetical protein WD939_03830 [Dehalococcoidia bacterium]
MPAFSVLYKACALCAALLASAFWHHGHILQFIAAVRDALPRRLEKHYELRSESSKLFILAGDELPRYELIVRRKTRSVEIGLAFEGEASEAARRARSLAERAVEIQAQLGPGVELEEQTKRRFRLYERVPVGGEEWRPKRDLTSTLAAQSAERLARFIEVLEPILGTKG